MDAPGKFFELTSVKPSGVGGKEAPRALPANDPRAQSVLNDDSMVYKSRSASGLNERKFGNVKIVLPTLFLRCSTALCVSSDCARFSFDHGLECHEPFGQITFWS